MKIIMQNLLLNEYPLIVLPSLAVKFGINEAIFLQQLHYWLRKSNHEIDGIKWCYNTFEEWHKQLTFISTRSLQRLVTNLALQNVIIIKKLNKDKRIKTNWYTINYSLFDNALFDNALRQTVVIQNDKLSLSSIYTETTSENTNNLNTVRTVPKKNNKKLLYTDDFENAWNLYPPRNGSNSKTSAFVQWQQRLKDGENVDRLILCTKNYQLQCNVTKIRDTVYVMQAGRFSC